MTVITKPDRPFMSNSSKAGSVPTTNIYQQPNDFYERSNLTQLQLLYWIAQKLRPETPLFNTVVTFTISGNINRECFEKAFQALIGDSDTLRTVIKERDGVPGRNVIANLPYNVEYFDFSQEAEPLAAFQTWLQKRCVIPLNLEECLFDSALIKISADQFVWYLNQHHLIADASSVFLVYEKLATFYESFLDAVPPEISGGSTFEKYVDYERSYRNSTRNQKAKTYWDRKLTPGPQPVSFFGQSPLKKTTQVERITYDLGRARSDKLRAMAKQAGIFTASQDLSLYNIFAALFFLQLHQISGNQRLGFVTPVHNRFSEAFKGIIGLVMELCPLQIEISEDDTFLSLIKKVQRETRETLSHYQYGSGISLRNEAFDVMFNTHHMPSLHLNGMPVQPNRIHPGHGSESLALHVYDLALSRNFVLNFDFHRDVFSREQCDQTIKTFVQLIDAFLVDSELSIKEVVGKEQLPTTNGETVQQESETNQIPTVQKRPYIAPRNALEAQLTEVWESVLDVHPVGIRDNFFDLGGSSWLATQLLFQIQKATGKNLPLSTMLKAATVEDMAGLIQKDEKETLWSSIVVLQPNGNRPPFFCVPGAGGSLIRLAKLVRHLGTDQPFYAFEVQGLDGENEPFTRIEDVATHYLEILRAAQPEGPYFLGGYSWGGIVAFEMARQLKAQGQELALLAIIDTPAQSPYFKYVRDFSLGMGKLLRLESHKQQKLFLFLRDYIFRFEYFLRTGYQKFFRLSLHEKGSLLRQKLKTAQEKIAKTVSRNEQEQGDFWSQFQLDPIRQKIVRINDRAIRSYIPQPYPGQAILFQSSQGYRNPLTRSAAPQLGWGKVITGGVESYLIPGDHLGMLEEPNVKVLAEKLRACLDKAQAEVATTPLFASIPYDSKHNRELLIEQPATQSKNAV